MVPGSAEVDSSVRRTECLTNWVWSFRLRFSGSLDGGLRLRGVQTLLLMDEDGQPIDGDADPSAAPVKGVLEVPVLPRGHSDEGSRATWAPLPERARGVAFASDVHCWELTRFYGDTQEEHTPVHVRCLLD